MLASWLLALVLVLASEGRATSSQRTESPFLVRSSREFEAALRSQASQIVILVNVQLQARDFNNSAPLEITKRAVLVSGALRAGRERVVLDFSRLSQKARC